MFFHSPADTKVSHINHFRGSMLIQVYFIDFCQRIDSIKLNIHTERNSSGFLIQILNIQWYPSIPHLTNWRYQICVRDIFSQDLKPGLALSGARVMSHAISLHSKEPRYWKSIGKAVCVVTVVTVPPARTLQYQPKSCNIHIQL